VICKNRILIRQELLDQAVIQAISEALDEGLLDQAISRAVERLAARRHHDGDRAAILRQELAEVEAQIAHLGTAMKSGKATDALLEMLEAEHARKKALVAELDLVEHYRVPAIEAKDLRRDLTARIGDVRGLLAGHIPQARQILRKLVVGRLACEAVEQDGRKGYRFAGQGAYDRVLPGETLAALTHTPNGVTPAGTARYRSGCGVTVPLRTRVPVPA